MLILKKMFVSIEAKKNYKKIGKKIHALNVQNNRNESE